MKKLGLVLLITLTSSIGMASCIDSYHAAKETLPLPTKLDTQIASPVSVVAADGISMATNLTPVPVFSIAGTAYIMSVSVDWYLKEDYRLLKKVLKEARMKAYSSEMEDLHIMIEDQTGLSLSEDELQKTIVELDEENAFCIDGVQGIEDFVLNIARRFKRK